MACDDKCALAEAVCCICDLEAPFSEDLKRQLIIDYAGILEVTPGTIDGIVHKWAGMRHHRWRGEIEERVAIVCVACRVKFHLEDDTFASSRSLLMPCDICDRTLNGRKVRMDAETLQRCRAAKVGK